MATRRKFLCGSTKSRGKIIIDMEKVYRMLDKGMTVADVAADMGVSQSTLRRRHSEYQKQIEVMEKNMELVELDMPPLPDFMDKL